MKAQVLRYDTTEDDAGNAISRFMIVSVTDDSFPDSAGRSEHTFSKEENLSVDDGLIGEVMETIAAEALDNLKSGNESNLKPTVSADAKELETLSSEIRDDYVLAKQAAIEEKRKIAIEPSPVIKIK